MNKKIKSIVLGLTLMVIGVFYFNEAKGEGDDFGYICCPQIGAECVLVFNGTPTTFMNQSRVYGYWVECGD